MRKSKRSIQAVVILFGMPVLAFTCLHICSYRPKFGKVLELTNGQEFLSSIEQESPQVNVVIHIYDNVSLATSLFVIFSACENCASLVP